jgi:hypothetical protein
MLTDEHLYTLTRSQFAKEIGKSREAVKKDMMRGKYKDLYIFKNNRYYFKTREAVRENKTLSPVNLYPVKRKINRGGHESAVRKGRYPNRAFAERNHMKKFIALRGKLSPKELAMVPDVERMVRQEREKQIRDTLETPGVNTRRQRGMRVGVGMHMQTQDEMRRWDFEPTRRGKKEVKEYY